MFSTAQQVNTKVSVLGYLIQYHTLVYLKILYVCTNLHFWNHQSCALDFSSETIWIITWRKWKLLVLFFSIMRFCQILVITLKSSLQWKKVLLKDTTIGVLTTPKQPFYNACLLISRNNRLWIGLSWMKRIWQPIVRERVIKDFNRLWEKSQRWSIAKINWFRTA